MDLPEKIKESASFIRSKFSDGLDLGIILGTGLGGLVKSVKISEEIAYSEVPHFVNSTVEFHEGKLILGELSGKKVMVMQGRFHFYEGYSMEQITFPVRVMAELGIQNLIISNACGGLNPDYKPGDIMIMKDHINLLGQNPLIGKNYHQLGPRFPDMSEPYYRKHIELVEKVAENQGLAIKKGVYSCMSGPSLETAAEYRMLQIIGSDVIGMSTVPEVIAAIHGGLKVLGLSVITDSCQPDDLRPVDLPEIIKIAGQAEPHLVKLIEGFVAEISIEPLTKKS